MPYVCRFVSLNLKHSQLFSIKFTCLWSTCTCVTFNMATGDDRHVALITGISGQVITLFFKFNFN